MDPSTSTEPSWLARLSAREEQVLSQAAEGLLDKQIAANLGVTENTLRTYWRRIRAKMGEGPRTALAALYLRRKAVGQIEADGEWTVDLSRQVVEYRGVRGILPEGETDLEVALRAFVPEDRERLRHLIDELASRDAPSVVVRARVTTPRGIEVISTLIEPIRDEKGRVIQLVGRHVPILDMTIGDQPSTFGTYRRNLLTDEIEIDEGVREIFRIRPEETDLREAILKRYCFGSSDKMRNIVQEMIVSGWTSRRWSARLCFEDGDMLWIYAQSRIEMSKGRPVAFVATVVSYL